MDKPEAGLKYEHTFNQTPKFNVRLTKLHRLPTEEFDRRAPTDALYHTPAWRPCHPMQIPYCIFHQIHKLYSGSHSSHVRKKPERKIFLQSKKKQFFP